MSDQADIRRPVSASKNLVEGEYPFTQEDFRNIAAMLHADAGIALRPWPIRVWPSVCGPWA